MSSIYTDSDTLDPRWCDLCKVKMRGYHTDTVRHRTRLKEAEMEDKGYVRLKQTSIAVSFSSWLTEQGLITRTTTPNVAWIPYWVDGLFSATAYRSMRTYEDGPEMAKLAVSYMLKDPDNLQAYLIWLDLAFSADDHTGGYFHESTWREAILGYLRGVGLFDEPPEEPEGAE